MPDEPVPSAAGTVFGFPATRWSLVMAARQGDTTVAQRALGELCQAYWYPLYAYARRRGFSPEDAEDITQDFFRSLIARESLHTTAPELGRLRGFLLAAIKRHMIDVHRRDTAEKRGGGQAVVSIDQERAEHLLNEEADRGASPEVLFDQSWAHAIVEAVMQELERWYVRLDRGELFAAIRVYLEWNKEGAPYAETAERLQTTEPAVRSAVHTMRQRFRQVIARHIAETVTSEAEAKEETEYLCSVLAQE